MTTEVSNRRLEVQSNGHKSASANPLNKADTPAFTAVKRYACTEFGNAERLLDQHGENIRWSKSHGFIVWTGKYWAVDEETTVQRWAKDSIRSIYEDASWIAYEAAHCEDRQQRKVLANEAEELTSWAKRSETEKMIGAMLALIAPYCKVQSGLFDNQPWLLNCDNGTLDLRTGELYSYRREDYLTKIIATPYNPLATCPIFTSFFSEIMLGNVDLIGYVQRVLGYTMTGVTREQEWYILLGSGENGKSTLMEAIAFVLEDYAQAMRPETITVAMNSRGGASPSPDIARLKGARLVTVSEIDEGVRLATSLLKQMAGQDRMTARFLRRDPFDFVPTHKLFLYTNCKPLVRETTHGFWRRVRLIPFEYALPTGKKDKDLPTKLQQEAQGILAWLVQGCLRWQSEGLAMPTLVQRKTEAYRNEQDIIGQFLREECVGGKGEAFTVQSSILYARYKEWSDQNMNERPMVLRSFNRMLEARGLRQYRVAKGMAWQGLRLRNEFDFLLGETAIASAESDQAVTLPEETESPLELSQNDQAAASDQQNKLASSSGNTQRSFIDIPPPPTYNCPKCHTHSWRYNGARWYCKKCKPL